jgi:hypothetical protein
MAAATVCSILIAPEQQIGMLDTNAFVALSVPEHPDEHRVLARSWG